MKKLFVFAGLALVANTAFAAGFEKSIMWGGETSGLAGIAAPQVSGATATYFNPAGLANGAEGSHNITLDVSPTSATFKSPVLNGSVQETSTSHWSLPAALMYSHKLTDKLGLGIGYYASGGNYAKFTGAKLTGVPGEFESTTDLQITEVGLGAGYKLMDNLNVGLEYRVVMGKANLATPIPFVASGGAVRGVAQVNLENLKDTNYQAFKLGAQYKLGKTDIGFTYRSEAVFHAKGTQTTTNHIYVPSSSIGASATQGVTAGTLFPAAWTLGFKHACTETFNAYGQYSLTEYSKVDNISLKTDDGNYSAPLLLKMHDQHIVALAGEYTGLAMPIRAGLAWGTQVSNSNPTMALPTATPPGQAWVVTAGTGYGADSWRVDVGGEYDLVKGTADTQTASHEVGAYTIHLGGSYTF